MLLFGFILSCTASSAAGVEEQGSRRQFLGFIQGISPSLQKKHPNHEWAGSCWPLPPPKPLRLCFPKAAYPGGRLSLRSSTGSQSCSPWTCQGKSVIVLEKSLKLGFFFFKMHYFTLFLLPNLHGFAFSKSHLPALLQ